MNSRNYWYEQIINYCK